MPDLARQLQDHKGPGYGSAPMAGPVCGERGPNALTVCTRSPHPGQLHIDHARTRVRVWYTIIVPGEPLLCFSPRPDTEDTVLCDARYNHAGDHINGEREDAWANTSHPAGGPVCVCYAFTWPAHVEWCPNPHCMVHTAPSLGAVIRAGGDR